MTVSTVSLPRFAAICFVATGAPFGVCMGLVTGSPALAVPNYSGFFMALRDPVLTVLSG